MSRGVDPIRALLAWPLGALALALVLAGCGGASSGSASGEGSPPARIHFESPAVRHHVMSVDFPCGQGTIWMPLKWGSVPPDTKELFLYIGRFSREKGAEKPTVPYASMIIGIKPTMHSIPINTFPPGVFSTSFQPLHGCPEARHGQDLLFQLYALDHTRHVALPPLTLALVTKYTEEGLGVGRFSSPSQPPTKLAAEALAIGRFTATYGPS